GGDAFGRGAGGFFGHATGFHGAAHQILVSRLGVRSLDAGAAHRDVRGAQGTASADRARSLTPLTNIIVIVRQFAPAYATFLVRGLKGCEYSAPGWPTFAQSAKGWATRIVLVLAQAGEFFREVRWVGGRIHVHSQKFIGRRAPVVETGFGGDGGCEAAALNRSQSPAVIVGESAVRIGEVQRGKSHLLVQALLRAGDFHLEFIFIGELGEYRMSSSVDAKFHARGVQLPHFVPA